MCAAILSFASCEPRIFLYLADTVCLIALPKRCDSTSDARIQKGKAVTGDPVEPGVEGDRLS